MLNLLIELREPRLPEILLLSIITADDLEAEEVEMIVKTKKNAMWTTTDSQVNRTPPKRSQDSFRDPLQVSRCANVSSGRSISYPGVFLDASTYSWNPTLPSRELSSCRYLREGPRQNHLGPCRGIVPRFVFYFTYTLCA